VAATEADEEPLANLVERIAGTLGEGPHSDYNAFLEAVEKDADKHDVKLTAKRLKLLRSELAERDEGAAPVVKKIHKPGKAKEDTLHGLYPVQQHRKDVILEYEPDSELRDSEQVSLLQDGGIEAFFRREVLPYQPDAWIDESATKIGYEVSFTRYFFKPQPLRTLDEIRADILATEKQAEGLLDEIISNIMK
jgi:type I restriction enzyme M protein